MARLGRSAPVQALVRQRNIALEGQLVWFAVYIIATGELFSVGSVVADPLDPTMAFVELARIPDGTVNWDTTLLAFVPRDVEPVPVDRVDDLLDDATLASAWSALDGTQTTAMTTRIGTMLGRWRFRLSTEDIDLPIDP